MQPTCGRGSASATSPSVQNGTRLNGSPLSTLYLTDGPARISRHFSLSTATQDVDNVLRSRVNVDWIIKIVAIVIGRNRLKMAYLLEQLPDLRC